MALRKLYELVCDSCGARSGVLVQAEAKHSSHASNETRSRARKHKWTRRDEQDLCPRCR